MKKYFNIKQYLFHLGYVERLRHRVYELRRKYPTYKEAEQLVKAYDIHNPGTLTSRISQHDKSVLVASHVSRFNNVE